MSIWPDWLKVIELSPRHLFGLGLLGAVLLFLPAKIAGPFGIEGLRNAYHGWIGVATLAAFVFWLVQLVPWFQGNRARARLQLQVLENLSGLTPQERFLLAYCIARGQRTLNLKDLDPAAISLCSKGLLERAPGVGSPYCYPHTIPFWVWKHIRENPNMILREEEWKDPDLRNSFNRFEHEMQGRQPI